MVTKIIAKTITTFLPPKNWYRAAFIFTKYYAKLLKAPLESWVRDRYGDSLRMNQAMKLETLLIAMTSGPTPPVFPIPVRTVGEGWSHLINNHPHGLMICTVHTPLNLAGVRYCVDHNLVIDGIIARYPPPEGYYIIPGTATRIPALTVDRNILLKVKRILERGGTVITLVDHLIDGQFSPNQFRLAAKLNAELRMVVVEFQPDGSIRNIMLKPTEAPEVDDVLDHRIKCLNKQALSLMSEWA
jgi:hypothetical protein